MTTLLAADTDTSSFKGMIRRPSEAVGAASLFCSPSTGQYVISTLLLSLMAATKVSDMIRLVNKAFQCLSVFNLLYLQRRFLALEGTLEKLQSSGIASSKLKGVAEQLDSL